MRLRQTQRGQQSQHLRITRRSRDDLSIEQPLMNSGGVFFKFDSEQEPQAMYSYDASNLSQSRSQIRLETSDVFEHPIVFDGFECGGDCGHRQHAATESRTEIVFFNPRRDCFCDETRADRNTAA